jgi:hypothetical protein
MTYTFLFYIFLCFVIGAGGSYVLFSSGRILAAILYFIGILAIEVYFGTQWFTLNGDKIQASSGPWPPAINVCPDLLSLYKHTDGTPYCVDTIGVTNGSFKKWLGTVDTTNYNNAVRLYTGTDAEQRKKNLCADMKKYGLTWEGVYDGTTCLGGNPPLPA